jgi:hypothetical protein
MDKKQKIEITLEEFLEYEDLKNHRQEIHMTETYEYNRNNKLERTGSNID